MKRILPFLLALFLLTSCGDGTEPSNLADETVITSQGADELSESDVVLRTQYPVYDKSCTYVSIVIENRSDGGIEFGTEWMLEKKVDGEWRKVEFMDDLAWTQPLFSVMPEGHYLDNCSLSIFKKGLTDGDYRIVKEIGHAWYAAEFKIGDSPITAESPHGFLPLSKLPADYSYEDAVADGVVVCGPRGMENMEKIGEFLRYANDRAWRGQMRIARFTTEGDMILTDVIRRHPDRFDCITDTTRDAFGRNEITTEYFSYLTCAEDNIYLSDSTVCDPLTDRALFIPECITAQDADTVRGMYSDPLGIMNYPALSVWSPDGEVRATSSGGVELSFSTSGWGTVWGIKAENQRDGMEITELVWEDNDICMVEATLPDGTYYYEFIRVDRESMKNIETVSYTFSSHAYVEGAEGIVIPE